jgi:hypothetical protein
MLWLMNLLDWVVGILFILSELIIVQCVTTINGKEKKFKLVKIQCFFKNLIINIWGKKNLLLKMKNFILNSCK